MEKALHLQQLRKTYEGGFEAVKGVDLSVEAGDFFALLGPNGAGKSTTIGLISSLITKTSGRIQIFGHDLDTDQEAAKRCLGLVPQEFNFNSFEPAVEILIHQAGFYGIPRSQARERAEQCLEMLGLQDKRRTPPLKLSGGMKRRLMIARALVHQPKLLILDEPTAGVDIEIRRATWELLQQLNEAGTTIILTTHYLEEAESLCRNVAIIDHGEIVEQGEVADLLSKAMAETFVFDIREQRHHDLQLQAYSLNRYTDTRLEVEVPRGQSLNALFAELQGKGIEVLSMRNKTNRLEEFFLRLVSRDKPESTHA
ncbi:MAG: ABC transporter ATP-binding protein [Granulosicoccaceae bacterium]